MAASGKFRPAIFANFLNANSVWEGSSMAFPSSSYISKSPSLVNGVPVILLTCDCTAAFRQL